MLWAYYPNIILRSCVIQDWGLEYLIRRIESHKVLQYRKTVLFINSIKTFVKVKSANLINIILEKNVVPEFLFEKCTTISIENSVKELLSNVSLRKKQKDFFKKVIRLLSTEEQRPSEKAAKISLKFLNEQILKI